MKTQLTRLAFLLVPAALGIAIGYAWNEAAHNGAGAAIAQEAAAAPGAQPSPAAAPPVRRVGSVVGVNRKTLDDYVILHKHVWPEVLQRIRDSNIRNYSIFMGELNDDELYLFSYMEYVGDDFDKDMEAIGNDPLTREWWKLTDPLQERVKNTPTGAQWKSLEEVFHTD